MFSGQGSQYYRMGEELYRQNAIFRKWMLRLNGIIYKNSGISVVDEIYNEAKKKGTVFNDMVYTHPAIFMVEYSLARVLIDSGIEPDYLLGASLGEFTSAAVAGVISVEETLEYLMQQVELLKSYCNEGKMIAIVHNWDLYNQLVIISRHSELAAVNYSSHFIISGNSKSLSAIEAYLQAHEILFQVLPVRYGFHSSNIDPIGEQSRKNLCNFSLKKNGIPVVSCLSGELVSDIFPGHFWDVLRQPIQFKKTIENLEVLGQYHYIDLGPSGTLANFTKRNVTKESISEVYSVLTPFGQDVSKLQRVLECLHFN